MAADIREVLSEFCQLTGIRIEDITEMMDKMDGINLAKMKNN